MKNIANTSIQSISAVEIAEALRLGSQTSRALEATLKDKGLGTTVGDEGGFAPRVTSHEEILQLKVPAKERAGYRPGEDIALAPNPAASGFFRGGRYMFSEKQKLTANEMTDFTRVGGPIIRSSLTTMA